MKTVLLIFGTRPEAIKMAPVIKELEKHPDSFKTNICITAQHREMLDQVLRFFSITPDYDLNLMQPEQSLFDITTDGLKGLRGVFDDCRPDIVCVQGDTTTAFIGSLAAFYKNVKIAHIEAGLRSGDKHSPYPEEINRILVGHLADYHFAPTEKATRNLLREGINQNVHTVGNTVVDALFLGQSIIKRQGDDVYRNFFSFLDVSNKIILVTGHRRESFGKPFQDICHAIREIATLYPDVQVVYPVHRNPNVHNPVTAILKGINNIYLIEPIDYPHLIWLLNKSFLVLTDSGGIQEEAPSLGKPLLVMREVTERTEGIVAGTAKLVGTDQQKIIREFSILVTDKAAYKKMSQSHNPYGDGKSASRIVDILKE
jgi:UDP-N-acetylglucosamine 2-epimerase (non-hydrolysing)